MSANRMQELIEQNEKRLAESGAVLAEMDAVVSTATKEEFLVLVNRCNTAMNPELFALIEGQLA